MEYLVGAGLALAVAIFAKATGFDRDRAFYPTVLVVVASYNDLFAVIGGPGASLAVEVALTSAFVVAAVVGFRTSLWVVVIALFTHGAFDLVHSEVAANSGIPAWWPTFCQSYDWSAALCLACALLWPRTSSARFARLIRPHVEAELKSAALFETAGDPAMAFRHLERAHVLGQGSTVEHVRVHAHMLGWGLRHRDGREVIGQLVRIVGAVTKTALGLIPSGNTGGAGASPFQPMTIPSDLAATLSNLSRSKPRARLWPVVAFGAALSASCTASAADDVSIAQVDGHAVAYRLAGSARPTVVLLAGLGDGMASFNGVVADLAKDATVVVYDRAGYGGSAKPDSPRDAVAADRELMAVLAQSGAAAPYVLVGHSLGGLQAEYFAAKHPDLVAGLILEESRPTDFGRRCEAAKIAACTPLPSMTAGMPAGAQAEVVSFQAILDQVEAAGRMTGKPVLILSRPLSENGKPFDQLWGEVQNDLAGRYAGSRHLNAPGGGHYIHKDQRAWFLATVRSFIQPLH